MFIGISKHPKISGTPKHAPWAFPSQRSTTKAFGPLQGGPCTPGLLRSGRGRLIVVTRTRGGPGLLNGHA